MKRNLAVVIITMMILLSVSVQAQNKFYENYPSWGGRSYSLVRTTDVPMQLANWTQYGTENGNISCNGTTCQLTVFSSYSSSYDPVHMVHNGNNTVKPGWMVNIYAEMCAAPNRNTKSDNGVGVGFDQRNTTTAPTYKIIGTLNGAATQTQCPDYVMINQSTIIPPSGYNEGSGWMGREQMPEIMNTTNYTIKYLNGTQVGNGIGTTSGGGSNYDGLDHGLYSSDQLLSIWAHTWFDSQEFMRIQKFVITIYQNISFTPPPTYNFTFLSPKTQATAITSNSTKITLNFTIQQDGTMRTASFTPLNVTIGGINSTITNRTSQVTTTQIRYNTLYNLNYYNGTTHLYANISAPYTDCGNYVNVNESFAPHWLANMLGIQADGLSVNTEGDLVLCTIPAGANSPANPVDSALSISGIRAITNSTNAKGVFWNATGNASTTSFNFSTKFAVSKLGNSSQFGALTFINGTNTITIVNITTANTTAQGNLSGNPWNNEYITVNFNYKCPESGCNYSMAVRAHGLTNVSLSSALWVDDTILQLGTNKTVITTVNDYEFYHDGTNFQLNITTPNLTNGQKTIKITLLDVITGYTVNATNITALLYGTDIPPTASSTTNSTNTTYITQQISLGTIISDDGELSHAWLMTNMTGQFKNFSATQISGQDYSITYGLTINVSKNTLVAWRIYFNDSINQIGSTDLQQFSVGNAPMVTTLTYPADGANILNGTNISVNWTANDLDNDTATAYLFVDGILTQSGTSNFTINLTDGTYNLSVMAGDAELNGSTDSVSITVGIIPATASVGYCSESQGLAPLLQLIGLLSLLVTIIFVGIVVAMLLGAINLSEIPAIENLQISTETILLIPFVGILVGIGLMVISHIC